MSRPPIWKGTEKMIGETQSQVHAGPRAWQCHSTQQSCRTAHKYTLPGMCSVFTLFFLFLNIPVLCPLVLCARADGGREGGEKGNQTAVDMLMRPCASVITELLQPFTSTIRGRPQSARQTRQPTASIKSSFFSERGAQFTSENKTKAIPFTLKIHLSNPWKCSGN